MVVYVLTILIVLATSLLAQITVSKYNDSNNNFNFYYNKFFVFMTGAVLIIVSGLRWQVGTDYRQYSIHYTSYVINIWEYILTLNEPGIAIIAKVSSWIFDDYVTMFFLAALITIGLSIRTIAKHSNMLTFSVLLYIFIGAWHGSFNGVRQYLACAIIFAGHRFIVERKFIKYLIVVLIASLFHMSALALLILYFIPLKKLNLKEIGLMAIITVIALYSYDTVFQFVESVRGRELSTYDYMMREVNLLRVAVQVAPLIIYFTLTIKKDLNTFDLFYINMLFVNAAVSIATSDSAYLARFYIYTSIFTTLAIPRLLNFKDKHLKSLLQYIIIILYLAYWYVEASGISFQWIFNRNY
ncbi:EpsG family protein [Bacillus sp. m3-13]|uniref:EpsG family protein n=1 Tax=Bacillus sp. m3-13 TaxID=406124 RepID=UPI0001E89E0D|nr:EpsG family protein [Bacillus sp. m3-13]